MSKKKVSKKTKPKLKKTTKKTTKSKRKAPVKHLTATLYSYVEPVNEKHAKTFGKRVFGSHSAYVNALIAKDRGVKPKLGVWRTKGESKALRTKKKVKRK